jgi:hypothetical protein
MSSTQISFKAKLKIGDQILPLASEIAFGDADSEDGVKKGFLFKLDLAPGDPPFQIDLGAMIAFIEQQLGAGSGSLQTSPGISTLQQIFPGTVSGSNFNSGNSAMILIKAFEINSTTEEFLFNVSVDVEGADPSKGFIPLPPVLSNWLSIDSVAISFLATSGKAMRKRTA